MHPMLNIAVRAARSAGQVITRSLNHLEHLEITSKGDCDFVTNIDHEAETVVIRTIQKAYPTHSILSEEAGHIPGEESDFVWVIDPLDGTRNFIRGIQHYCISIALRSHGKTELAVVFDPLRDELFSATRGRGAQLNGYRIRASTTKSIQDALIASSLPSCHKHDAPWLLALQAELFAQCQDLRSFGSGALDLAYVAAGRFDAAILVRQKSWDFAAGELLVREAGALTTNIDGSHDFETTGNILATTPRLAKGLLNSIRIHLPKNV